MGLPWIKVYADLPDHPKSLDLGVFLENPLAWGHVLQLWLWCSRFARDGRVPRAHAERAAGWNGERGRFICAAVTAGFLEDDLDDKEHLIVHDWDVTQQAHLEKAERDAAQKAQKRRAPKARQKRGESSLEERRGEREEKEKKPSASADAPRAPRAPDAVDVNPAPAPVPEGPDRLAEAVKQPVGGDVDLGADDIPDGADGTWQLPWAGRASRRIPGRGEKKTRPDKLVMFVEWMLYRQGERGDEETDLAWGQVLALLKRAVAAHGEELVRKAWLAWLMDPWAAGLSPPYQLVKFLAVEQVKKQVARAKAFGGWEVDKLAPEDWQLPWLIDERREEA